MSPDTCATFRDRMLEADPPELRGEGDSPLARHLRVCASCARAAEVLLEETARLDTFLGDGPEVDLAALLARARREEAGGIAQVTGAQRSLAAPPGVTTPGRRRAQRILSRRLWIPLAAAAAVTAVLLLRPAPTPTPTPPTSVAATIQPALPVVEPAAGQDAAIIQTDDPEITVIWLFKTG